MTLIVDVSVVTINARKIKQIQSAQENYCQFNSFYPAELFVRKESKIEAFADMQKQREFTLTLSLKDLLRIVLQKKNDKLTQKEVVRIRNNGESRNR